MKGEIKTDPNFLSLSTIPFINKSAYACKSRAKLGKVKNVCTLFLLAYRQIVRNSCQMFEMYRVCLLVNIYSVASFGISLL